MRSHCSCVCCLSATARSCVSCRLSFNVPTRFDSRLGEPAAGDGLSRHFPLSRVDSVPGAPPLPALPHQHLGFQVAHCADHVRSGKWRPLRPGDPKVNCNGVPSPVHSFLHVNSLAVRSHRPKSMSTLLSDISCQGVNSMWTKMEIRC